MSAKIKITVDNNELKRGLQDAENQASKSFQNINNNAKKTGEGFKSLFKNFAWVLNPVDLVLKAVSTIKNLITGIMDSAHNAMIKADGIAKTARSLNMTSEGYQAISYAAQRAGTNVEKVNSLILNVQNSVSKAVNGNMNLARSFDKVGLSIARLSEMSTEGQLLEIINVFEKFKNNMPEMINALTSLGFEKEQIRTLTLLSGKGFKEDIFAAKGRGAVISSEDISAAEVYSNAILEYNNANVQLGLMCKTVLEARNALEEFKKSLVDSANENNGRYVTPNGLKGAYMTNDEIISEIKNAVEKFDKIEDFTKYAVDTLEISEDAAKEIYNTVKNYNKASSGFKEFKNYANGLGLTDKQAENYFNEIIGKPKEEAIKIGRKYGVIDDTDAEALWNRTKSQIPLEDERKVFITNKTMKENSRKFTKGKFEFNPEDKVWATRLAEEHPMPNEAFILYSNLKNGTDNWQTGSLASDLDYIDSILTVPQTDKRYKKYEEYKKRIADEFTRFRENQARSSTFINKNSLTQSELNSAKKNAQDRNEFINYSISDEMRRKGYGSYNVEGFLSGNVKKDIETRGKELDKFGRDILYSEIQDSWEQVQKYGHLEKGDDEALTDIKNKIEEYKLKISKIRESNNNKDTDESNNYRELVSNLQELHDFLITRNDIKAKLVEAERAQISDLEGMVKRQRDIQKTLIGLIKNDKASKYYDFDINKGTMTLKKGLSYEDEKFIDDHLSNTALDTNEVTGIFNSFMNSEYYKNGNADIKELMQMMMQSYLVNANTQGNGKITADYFSQDNVMNFITEVLYKRALEMDKYEIGPINPDKKPEWNKMSSQFKFKLPTTNLEVDISRAATLPEDKAKEKIESLLIKYKDDLAPLFSAMPYMQSKILEMSNEKLRTNAITLDSEMSKRKTEQQRAKMNEYEKALGFAKDNVEQTKNRGVFSIVNAGNDLVGRGGFSSAASIITNSPKAFQQASLEYQKIVKEYLINLKSNVSTITDAYRE